MNRKWWKMFIAAVIVFLGTNCSGQSNLKYPYPRLRIPKMEKAPVIDGYIQPEEWKAAACVTGFVNFGFPPLPLPMSLQPVWYLGYDDHYFYLAFRYPVFPPGTLRAKVKTKEKAESQFFTDSILMDDHTEIQIVNIGRKNAIRGHFYKFMTNPWDQISDQKVQYSIGQFGYEYESDALVKSHFTETYWEQEIAIPLKSLNEKKIPDGYTWVLQLVCAQDPGSNFYTWALDGHWLHNDQHPEVIFDSQAIALQFVSLGDWMRGNPDLTFHLYNPGKTAKNISLKAEINSPLGICLFTQEKSVTVPAGISQTVHLSASNLKLSDRLEKPGRIYCDNQLNIEVTEPSSGKTYYQASLPLIKENSKEVTGYIKNLQAGRRPAEVEMSFAYMPGYNLLKAEADVGILGLDKKIKEKARFFRVSFGPATGQPLGFNSAPFKADGTAQLVFHFPPLPEGKYWITMEVLDKDGAVLTIKKESFSRKIFPFENNTLGLTETILPPYKPIELKGNQLSFTSGSYTLAELALPVQITNSLVPVNQELLAEEISLWCYREGKKEKVKGSSLTWQILKPEQVTAYASGNCGPLTVQVNAQAEYDGQYVINLNLIPRGRVPVDKLVLEVPLKNPVDTITVSSPDSQQIVYQNEFPYKPGQLGQIWSNTTGRVKDPYIIYLGTGERGLYWFTNTYQNWHLNRDLPFVTIEKTPDSTVLKVALINEPFVLKQPRILTFAFLSVPVKPLPADARQRQWDNDKSHVGGGSWWGTVGCFVFPQKPEDWWANFEGRPFEYKGHKVNTGFWTIPYPTRGKDGKYYLEKNKEYGAYRAADLIGYLQPEFEVFSGEWVDRTNPPLQPDAALLRYQDKDKNPVWPEPEQRSVYLKDCLTKSFIDFEVYYFYQMAKNTGVGGYWWDWHSFRKGNSLLKGTAYLTDYGTIDGHTSLFLVREMYKRIALIDYQLGIPNTNNVYAPGPVYQISWIERINAWESMYLESESDDMFTAHGLDKYRAIIGKYSGLPVTIVMNIPINMKDQRSRSVIALSLLHDNGIFGIWKQDQPGEITRILKDFGYFSPETEWIPYWRSSSLVKNSQAQILTTVYKRKDKDSTHYLLVLVNSGDEDLLTDVILQRKLTGKEKAVLTDLETGKIFSTRAAGQPVQLTCLRIKSHDFRLVGITVE